MVAEITAIYVEINFEDTQFLNWSYIHIAMCIQGRKNKEFLGNVHALQKE
jgi:hypothetical protein